MALWLVLPYLAPKVHITIPRYVLFKGLFLVLDYIFPTISEQTKNSPDLTFNKFI